MLPFAPAYLAWLAATMVPALAGLAAVVWVGSFVKRKYLAGLGFGIFLWFFVDTIEGSADLYALAGFAGGAGQVAAVVLFVAGALACLYLGAKLSSIREPSRAAIAVPLLAALAVGIHGFGEGTAFGSTAALTSVPNAVSAFGGILSVSSYLMHKAVEPMMVGALLVAYAGDSGGRLRRLRDVVILGMVFAIPSAAGAATGYFINYDASYGYALGSGTSVYVGALLVRNAFAGNGSEPGESLRLGIALTIGFILIYLAALLHS